MPPSMTTSAPTSSAIRWPAVSFWAMSVFPSASGLVVPSLSGVLIYWTSVNPSAFNSPSAIYMGAKHVTGASAIRIRVVSGGGSAVADLDVKPRMSAVPARVGPRRNSRRLHPFSPWLAMTTLLCEMRVSDDRGYCFDFGAGWGPVQRSNLVILVRLGIFDDHVAALDVAVSLKRLRNAATRSTRASDMLGCKYPTTGTAGCCARAARGHAAVSPSSVMKSCGRM